MIGNAFALLSLVDNVFQDADNGNICFIIFWNFYGLEAILVEGLEFYLRMNFYPVLVCSFLAMKLFDGIFSAIFLVIFIYLREYDVSLP